MKASWRFWCDAKRNMKKDPHLLKETFSDLSLTWHGFEWRAARALWASNIQIWCNFRRRFTFDLETPGKERGELERGRGLTERGRGSFWELGRMVFSKYERGTFCLFWGFVHCPSVHFLFRRMYLVALCCIRSWRNWEGLTEKDIISIVPYFSVLHCSLLLCIMDNYKRQKRFLSPSKEEQFLHFSLSSE